MRWTDDYIEIPFLPDGRDRSGLDCWGMVCLVYRERLGIELPEYRGVFVENSVENLKRVAQVMKRERLKWRAVDMPSAFDVVMLRSGVYAWHVGVVVDRHRMLHITEGIDSTVEDFTGIQWGCRVEGFYRYDADVAAT